MLSLPSYLAGTATTSGPLDGSLQSLEQRNRRAASPASRRAQLDAVIRAHLAPARAAHALRAQPHPQQDPRPARRPPRGVRPTHHHRVRPLPARDALRSGPRLRCLRVRRHGGAARRRPDFLLRHLTRRQGAEDLHPARTAVAHRRHHALQSPAQPGRAQTRPGHRRRRAADPEAFRENAAHRRAPRRAALRGRTARPPAELHPRRAR